jgi:hypothetical protein
MKILNAKAHSIIDYIVVAFLWISVSIFSFSHFVSVLTLAVGGVHLVLTLITNFKFGLFKILAFKVHGIIELIVSIALMLSPWLLNFSHLQIDRLFYIGFGMAVFITWAITDYKSA